MTEENKFRQKDQSFYSGLIVLNKRYLEAAHKGKKGQQEGEEEQLVLKRERLCALQVNIPKVREGETVRGEGKGGEEG